MINFYMSVPLLTVTHALNICYNFNTIQEFFQRSGLNSSYFNLWHCHLVKSFYILKFMYLSQLFFTKCVCFSDHSHKMRLSFFDIQHFFSLYSQAYQHAHQKHFYDPFPFLLNLSIFSVFSPSHIAVQQVRKVLQISSKLSVILL